MGLKLQLSIMACSEPTVEPKYQVPSDHENYLVISRLKTKKNKDRDQLNYLIPCYYMVWYVWALYDEVPLYYFIFPSLTKLVGLHLFFMINFKWQKHKSINRFRIILFTSSQVVFHSHGDHLIGATKDMFRFLLCNIWKFYPCNWYFHFHWLHIYNSTKKGY